MIRNAVALALFSASISAPDFAFAQAQECLSEWGGIHCPRGVVSHLTDDQPPQCDVRCDDGTWMPTPRLECLIRQGKHNSIYTCEVWPRARGMIYKWKGRDGTLALTDETESVAQEISCRPHDTQIRIELRATAPSQATRAASFLFSCGSDPIIYLQGREISSTR